MKHQTIADLIGQKVLESFKEAIVLGDEYLNTDNKKIIKERLEGLTVHENTDVKASAYFSLGRIYIYEASKAKSKDDLKGILKKALIKFNKSSKEPKSLNIERLTIPIVNFL